MTKLCILLLSLAAALLLTAGDLRDTIPTGTIYYVAPNGDDANPGTLTRPWRTIQHAADTLAAGETVYIRAGTYHEQVVPQNSGSAGQVITYAAYPGETAAIDGSGVTVPEWEGLFNIVNKAHIHVSGLQVVNAESNPHNPGILVEGSSHVSIEDNFVSHTNDSGIGVWSSHHIVVRRNEVEQACLGGFNESISVGGTDVFEVSHNRVHDGLKEGIDLKDGSSNGQVFGNEVYNTQAVGVYVDAWDKPTHDIEVYQNVVHDVAAMGFAIASEMGGLLEDIRLYNNIAYHNRYVGIWLSGCCPESPTHPVRNIQIVNNTLYNNGWADWGGGIGIENTQAQSVTLRNNIVSQNLYFQIAVDPAFPPTQMVVDHNLIDGYRGTEGEIRGNDYVEGHPRFVNAAAADFHLRPDSPAIDHGSAQVAPDTDFDGHPRPQDGDGDGAAGYDIGAYEASSPANTPTPSATLRASPTATPTSTPTQTPSSPPTGTSTPTPSLTPTRSPTPTATQTPTATAPPGCFYDVNVNGIVDVADIVATGARLECRAYLPIIVARWRQPWPTATLTPTATATAMPTATPTGTRTPTPTAGLCPGPEPPLITDLQVRQPPALAEPAPRTPFRDPAFGRCVVRVTDRTNDKAEPGGLKNEYSRVQSFNADETRLLAMSTQGGWYLYNAQTLQPLGPLPLGIDPRWSATDPDLIYFSEETRLMSYHLATQQTALVHEFAGDFPGQNLAAVWTRYEGSPSRDGRWWGLMAEDGDWLTAALLVYDLAENRVTATLDTRGWSADGREMDSVTISPLGNYFLVYMDLYCPHGQLGTPANPCGLMVYDRNLQNGRGLLRIVGHSDAALDVQGREVLVYQDIDTDHISMLDLATGAVTPLWPIDFTYTGIGLHISGRGLDRPGWAVISTHDEDAASHTWMDDQVFLIELKASGRVVRLAHTHSLVDPNQEHDYWAEPQASANHDLSRVLFTTNWGRSGTEGVEMYLIEMPAGWDANPP